MRCVGWVLVLASGLGATALAAPKAASKTSALPTLEAEEYAVFRAVLVDLHLDANQTLLILDTIPAGDLDAGLAEMESPDLEQKTVDSYRELNRHGGRVEARFGLPNPVYLLSKDEQAKPWGAGGSGEAGRRRSLAAHPNTTGVLAFSRVGINHDHTQALVSFGVQSHGFAGGGALYELEKFHGKWKVVQAFGQMQF